MTDSKSKTRKPFVSDLSVRKPYESPRLTRQGHMAQVTQKSGAAADNSQSWPNKK